MPSYIRISKRPGHKGRVCRPIEHQDGSGTVLIELGTNVDVEMTHKPSEEEIQAIVDHEMKRLWKVMGVEPAV